MPKVKKGVSYIKTYFEENIEKATDAIRKGMSFHAASVNYNIPRSTVRFRMSDKFSKITPGPPPALGYEREKELVNWIIECCRKGFPRRKENLQASIKNFLNKTELNTPFKDNIPGDGWYKSFLRRHPILTERFPEGVTSASACVGESDIRKWFNDIHEYLSQEGYLHLLEDPTRLFNTDETYFMVCPKMKYVLAPRGTRNVYEIEKGNAKLNLTVLFTFSASGVVTPPTVLYPYTRLPPLVAHSVPDHWGIGATPIGWMNSDLFCEYINNVFYPYLIKEKITFPVILFLDGHSSHLTMEVSKLCSKLQIIIICLYPNSTRLLQPADVAAFKPLKSMWKSSVLEWRQNNLTVNLTLDRMAPILEKAVNRFSSNSTAIKSRFKACGLYPWDPNAVDYSKCLGESKTKNGSTLVSSSMDKKSISFEEFKNLVGNDLLNDLNSFKLQEGSIDEKSAEFVALFKLFKEFGKNEYLYHSNQTSEAEINQRQGSSQNEVQYLTSSEKIIEPLNETCIPDHAVVEFQNLEDIPIIIVNSAQENDFQGQVCEFNNFFEEEIDVETEEMRKSIDADPDRMNDNLMVVDENFEINGEIEEMFDLNVNNYIVDQTENDDALDLSLSHRRDCPKKLNDFLDLPPTPKRKGKKFTERRTYAVTSSEWKLNETKKFEKQKLDRKIKETRKLEIAEKKKVAEKEKELKKLNQAKKKEEMTHKPIKRTIKKENVDQSIKKKRGRKPKNVEKEVETKEDINNKSKKPTVLSNEKLQNRVIIISNQNSQK